MGGTAILIHGDIHPRRLEQPRGFISRLLGRPETRKELPEGFVDLPSKDLRILADDFAAFLKARLPKPTASTQVVLDYLDTAKPNVYLRGDQDAQETRTWYVQLGFSGCAGMAEASAQVAAHWAMLWYAGERPRIDSQLLSPAGFTAASVELIAEPAAFLPVGSGGYASYPVSPAQPETGGEFEIDAAAAESDEAEAERVQGWLASNGVAMVRQNGCHCQLCAPGFDPARIPGFTGN